jgi:hypothetical protein
MAAPPLFGAAFGTAVRPSRFSYLLIPVEYQIPRLEQRE